MTDIVERLRREEKIYGSISDKRVLIEAADEIERLRDDIRRLLIASTKDIDQLHAEIERLRTSEMDLVHQFVRKVVGSEPLK